MRAENSTVYQLVLCLSLQTWYIYTTVLSGHAVYQQCSSSNISPQVLSCSTCTAE